jgi:protein TonB
MRMATDTARVRLELASGRNEITAPFHQTVERKRIKAEAAAATDAVLEQPLDAQVVVAVPVASATSLIEAPLGESRPIADRPTVARPPWLAFIAAILVVAAAVWWVMSQRMPDLDPQEIVQRNLVDARQAMAAGRYTDPPERSALHYYSTVLALDPANADAIAGIDAIADRHVTDARVLLADHRVAEAGVALDKARRVRPDHNGLGALDAQLRAELRSMLIAAAAAEKVPVEAPRATKVKARGDAPPPVRTAMTKRKSETVPSQAAATASPSAAAKPKVANVRLPESLAPVATLANNTETPPLVAPTGGAPGDGPSVDESSAAASSPAVLPEPAPATVIPSVEPKLIKMVQPEYPQEALMRGVEGWVEVSLQVTAAGKVEAARVEATSRGRLFNRAALAAVEQWQYEPRGDGAPTERLRVRLQFRQSN